MVYREHGSEASCRRRSMAATCDMPRSANSRTCGHSCSFLHATCNTASEAADLPLPLTRNLHQAAAVAESPTFRPPQLPTVATCINSALNCCALKHFSSYDAIRRMATATIHWSAPPPAPEVHLGVPGGQAHDKGAPHVAVAPQDALLLLPVVGAYLRPRRSDHASQVPRRTAPSQQLSGALWCQGFRVTGVRRAGERGSP